MSLNERARSKAASPPRLPRARLVLTAALAATAAVACGNPRSLVRVYVDGDKAMPDVTLSLTAVGAPANTVVTAQFPSMTVPMMGADQLKIGLYLPSAMHGSVLVRGVAISGGCEIGAGETTATNVESGAVVTINLTLRSEACVPVGDGGADGMSGSGGGPGGSGGNSGSGGAPGTGGSGTGGAPGTGGAGSGGMTGSGGTPGTGGAGTGGAPEDAGVDVPPDLGCMAEPESQTCGLRCNLDVPNNCGDVVHCGDCSTPGDVCGGGGIPNVCAPCKDNRVCRGIECGNVVDACGQKVSCGSCLVREVCCLGRCTLPIRCPVATQ